MMPEQDFSNSAARDAGSSRGTDPDRESSTALLQDDGESLSLIVVLFTGLGLALLLNTFISLYPA